MPNRTLTDTASVTWDAATAGQAKANVHLTATDKVLGRSTAGAGAVEEIACTAAGRAILDDADASTQRATLGLGGAATLNVGTTTGTVAAGDHNHSGVYAAASHSHAESDVTGLTTDLAAKAPLASPTLTGTPAAPTAAVDTNTTQIATTAMVLGQAASATPAALGTAAVGTSTRYARADHVHSSEAGRLLATTVLTSASANHTTNAAAAYIEAEIQGGGASGGGATGGGTGASAGGGGGGGALAFVRIAVAGNTAYAYTCGAGGAAGTAGNNPGNDGTASTLVIGATTITAPGGKAGSGNNQGTGASVVAAGAITAQATNGTLNGFGSAGYAAHRIATASIISGRGGESAFGVGGASLIIDAVGNAGSGYGAGGGGGGVISSGAVSRSGGAGAPGCIIVREYS